MARYAWAAWALCILLVVGCSHDLDSLRADASSPPRDSGSRDTGTSDGGAGDSGAGDSGAGDSGSGDSGAGDSGAGDSGSGDSGSGDPCDGLLTDVELASAAPVAMPSAGLSMGPPTRLNVWRFERTAPIEIREIGFVGTKDNAGNFTFAIVRLADENTDPAPGPISGARVGPFTRDPGILTTATDITTPVDNFCIQPGWYAVVLTAEDGVGARISGGHATDPSDPGRPYVVNTGSTSTQSGDVRIFLRGRE